MTEMTDKKEGFSARELLAEVFGVLQSKLDGKEVKLPSSAEAEIASDLDWHKTRVGYTSYESAVLLKVGDKEWAIAFGTACGSYPANPYNCDIAAVQLRIKGKSNEQVAAETHRGLEDNSYFRNSLIYAMADGRLAVNEHGRFGRKVLEPLRPRASEFVAQDLAADPRCFTMDLRPVVKSDVRYKKEFVAFLADIIRTALAA